MTCLRKTVVALGIILVANLLSVSAQTEKPLPDVAPITVTFWNIQWFPGRRPNASRGEEQRQIKEVHRDMAQLAPDIIGLEEIRDLAHAGLAVAPLSGFKVDVCSNFPPREGQTEAQQVAIASRLQPISAWSEAWKQSNPITPPRGFAFAAYQPTPKNILLVYALHLKSNRGEIHEDIGIREESMRQLLSHMREMEIAYRKLGELTWLVGGDFNTAPDDPRFRDERTTAGLTSAGFQWAWKNVSAGDRVTLPPDGRFPAACFDQIYFRNATISRAWVAPTSAKSSDHRAVNVTLNLPGS